METRAHALIAGLFVLAIAGLLGFLVWWLSNGEEAPRVPYVVVSNESVFGLAEHSAVSYRGVPVGTIERIRLDPEGFDQVLIDVLVDRRVPIGRNSYAALKLEGITGSVQLEIGDNGDRGPLLETSAEAPARIPLRPSLLGALESSGQNLLAQLSALIEDLRALINNPQESSLSGFLAGAEEAMTRLIELEKGLEPTVAALPAIAEGGGAALEGLDKMITDANDVVLEVGTRLEGIDDVILALEQVAGATGQAGEVLARDTLPRLNALLEELDGAAESLARLVDSLERNPQSLLLGPPRQEPGPGEGDKRRRNP